MPSRQRRNRVIIDGLGPEDLAARCAMVWADIRLVAQHAVAATRAAEQTDLQTHRSTAARPPGLSITPDKCETGPTGDE